MTELKILGDIYLHENADQLLFGNRVFELRFSKKTGCWVGFDDRQTRQELISQETGQAPPVLIRVGGKFKQSGVVRNSRVFDLDGSQEIGCQTRFMRYRTVADSEYVSLEVETQEGNWNITNIYRLAPGSDTLIRDLRIAYTGEKEVLLRDVRLLVPFIKLNSEERTYIEAPGYPVPSHFPLTLASQGTWPGLDSRPMGIADQVQHSVDAPGSLSGLVAISSPEKEINLMCWPYSSSEFAIQELEKQSGSVCFTTWIFLADRFERGHVVEAGRQYLRLYHGSWSHAMTIWQKWFEQVGIKTPSDRPDWTNGAAIYEIHVGQAPFLDGINYEPYPTMADVVNDVPRIADLGFDVIQVMPHWPFCGYTVHDYYQIDKQYGDPEQLKALTYLAHTLGLHVILDVVLHGCVDREIIRWDMSVLDSRFHFIFEKWLIAADERSHYRDEHPEWFMQSENGQTARIYTWAFDHLNPSFQEYLIDVLKHYLNEFGVDGFRFDAPSWNCIPNWKPGLPYRPSAAYYGCHNLMQRVRQEIKSSYPQAMLYTEPSGPLFRNTMDLTYNYDEEWLSGSLVDTISERGFAGARYFTGERITARQAAEWLHNRRLSLPPGSQTVHHLDSHDTFWWGEKAQFRHEAFGVGASRALFAMFALVDGGIMNYVGAEKGSEDFYRNLIRLRQGTPALRVGACDYLAIHAEPACVLALLRSHAGEVYIPVINFGSTSVVAQLKLSNDFMELKENTYWLIYDVFNHELICPDDGPAISERWSADRLDQIMLHLPAYGVRVLHCIPTGNSHIS